MFKFGVLCLFFLAVANAALSKQSLAKMQKDIERVTVNPDFHKRGENLFSSYLRSDEDYKPAVRNVQKRDVPVTIYENPISFMSLTCANESHCYGIDTSYTVYQTFDSMMHWTVISAIATTSQVYATYISPENPRYVFFLGKFTTYYSTKDGGQTFQTLNANVHVEGIQLHPHVPDYLIGNDGNDGLYFSNNFGGNWIFVKESVYDYDFCNGALSAVAPRICMITSTPTNPSTLVRTDDLGKTMVELLPVQVDYIVPHSQYTFVIGNKGTMTVEKTLYISPSQGENFKEIQLPHNLKVPYFTPDQILDDTSGSIFIGINHDSQWGGLHDGFVYSGDGTGYRFSEVFQHCSTKNNWWDFDLIRSIEGSYITNMLLTWETDVPGGDQNENDQELKTYVTYDNGDTWKTLTAPPTDVYGNQIQCTGTCTLNLFGKTTWLGVGGYGYYGDFWTSPNAVGLIIGTGNTGDNLLFRPDEVNTYMSADAGTNWYMISEGSTVYEFGDMGGILIMAHNQIATNVLYYSLDQGQTWTSLNFSSSPVIVVNVYSTSDTYGRFVVFSVRNNRVVYFGIDFTNSGLRTCTESDFQDWEVTPRGDCFLGRKTIYRRKLKDSICKHSADYSPIKEVANCACQESDYECDEGFERSLYNDNCLKVDNSTPACGADGIYLQSSGYRLIPGDSCVGPLAKYNPTEVQCTPPPPDHQIHVSKSVIFATVLVALLVLGGAIFIGFLIGLKNERFRNKFSWVKIPNKFTKFTDNDGGYDNKIQMIDDEEEK